VPGATLDKNGIRPFTSAGAIQLNELTNSTATPTFGKNVPSSTLTDPAVLEGWGRARLQLGVTPSAAQHQLAPARGGERAAVVPRRRKFGNQTVTVDTPLQFRQQQLRRSVVLRQRASRCEPAQRRATTRSAACMTLKPSVVAQAPAGPTAPFVSRQTTAARDQYL